jgi:peroxiredoxin Q/BCP
MMRNLILTSLSVLFLAACTGNAPEVGSVAPDFRLQDQNGEWHQRSDYEGKWLAVYFYPKNDTPGCTTEACNFRDNIYQFEAIGASVVGISVDSVSSHQEFADKYKLPFTLLSDESGDVCRDYGVLRDAGVAMMASRQSFLVNPEGVIVKHYQDVDPDTHTQEVLADITRLQTET